MTLQQGHNNDDEYTKRERWELLVGDTLYFSATDGSTGNQLWATSCNMAGLTFTAERPTVAYGEHQRCCRR